MPSCASGPAINDKSRAQSPTLRASTPMQSSECDSGMVPYRLTRPSVGLMPTTPQAAAGRRTEPPVSEPSAPNARAAATAAPDPDEEPPVMWSGFHGFRQRP
jgi:hypothetical protein